MPLNDAAVLVGAALQSSAAQTWLVAEVIVKSGLGRRRSRQALHDEEKSGPA